ncbi:hypothetical protein [Proteiniclasticum sediminis]|nr:hypothetical protein [Proteiniclasticum sediminis]
MNQGSWIAIYMPLFILFVVILPEMRRVAVVAVKRSRKRRKFPMNHEIIQKYIGSSCRISTGSFGNAIVGVIRDVKDNWIEVETKKGMELVNAEFVLNIRALRG